MFLLGRFCLGLFVLVVLSVSSACRERSREIVYLDPPRNQVADPTEWDRFAQICEAEALRAGARRISDMDSYPLPGCRYWWLTERSGAIRFNVDACPQEDGKPPHGGPNAEVGTWPHIWNPLSIAEAEGRRAALYDALRAEFGDRIRVEPL
jgi:hypothetical protein